MLQTRRRRIRRINLECSISTPACEGRKRDYWHWFLVGERGWDTIQFARSRLVSINFDAKVKREEKTSLEIVGRCGLCGDTAHGWEKKTKREKHCLLKWVSAAITIHNWLDFCYFRGFSSRQKRRSIVYTRTVDQATHVPVVVFLRFSRVRWESLVLLALAASPSSLFYWTLSTAIKQVFEPTPWIIGT